MAIICIVLTSVKVENIAIKGGIFILLGAAAGALVWNMGGQHGHHELHHIFLDEYPKFIGIPLITVLIASMNLFDVKVTDDKAPLGWFLGIICPIIGNFATTWAVVPVCLGLVPVIKKAYPKNWLKILIIVAVFSMNFLALATLLADPPQALWAILESSKGNEVGFFRPLQEFWLYMIFTWALYLVALHRLGVRFGGAKNLTIVRPTSWKKVGVGLALAGCIATGLMHPWMTKGYNIAFFLGGVFLLGSACLLVKRFGFDHDAKHNTFHWSIETTTIFVAFFAVAALAGVGLKQMGLTDMQTIPVIIGKTWGADNAAAFRVAYSQFGEMANQDYIVWFGLFNSVVEGGASPFGNGPQIVFFLVILVGMGLVTVKEILIGWMKLSLIFVPNLIVWALGMALVVKFGAPDWSRTPIQFILGFIGLAVSLSLMDAHPSFQNYYNRNGESSSTKEDEPAE